MIDAGYFPKRLVPNDELTKALKVRDICSVSECVSRGPEGWIEHWLHNELGWFNRIPDALAVVPANQREAFRLFAYRIHPEVFHGGSRLELVLPADVHPEPIPDAFERLGFDSVNRSVELTVGFECSPLSCNYMAAEMKVNEHCLFDSLGEAIAGATRFSIEQPEPGDYYVIEVLERRHTGQR